ncbi:ABC transporter ATP-binding protein [Myxococcota bacterium]|nr:ABC transporter ATP-binding protein [Myxococcota bacterium]
MLLAFQGVRKVFGSFAALDDVTARVEGRAIGLLGPNGAGKTTLMKICLGLLAPDAGDATVLGLDVRTQAKAIRMRLGYAAEGAGRIPGLSGLESVAYAGELCGLRRADALRRAHEMLDLVGLDESRHRGVETYSTGMHQRVKVAMALVHDPALVLLDEPTTGLDPESRDALLDLIVQLRDGGGPAVLLSTHLLHDVERTCDACVIMQSGRVRFAGPLADLQVMRLQTFDLRTRGPAAPLAAWLGARGCGVATGRRDDALTVRLPENAEAGLIWAGAAASGCALWHLEAQSASLEEAFLEAIGPKP